jgi:threonine dehydrogenase-like Zn-dependent dehydrogenase
MTDEQALFLGDIFPTGWMAADNCEIEPADIVAIWGCGLSANSASRAN